MFVSRSGLPARSISRSTLKPSFRLLSRPKKKDGASWFEDAGSSIAQTRLQWIAIPFDPAEQVRRNQVDGIRLRSSSEAGVDHVLAKVAFRGSPDGRFLIFQRGDPRRFDLWMLSLSGEHKASSLFDESDITRTYPQISPDGRWLAYTSDESGREEIHVQPFPALGDKCQISVGGGEEPRWSSDDYQLFFRHSDRVMAVDVQTKSMFKAQRARLLFEGPYARSDFWTNYDMAADGQRFVMLKEEDEARATPVLRVVLNGPMS